MTNKSSNEIQYLEQVAYTLRIRDDTLIKLSVVVLASLLFIYINSMMFYTLLSRPVFRELPRYVLFAHMLCNDTVQMAVTSMLFIMVMYLLQLTKALCAVIVYVSAVTYRNAAFNVAVMSLERYVAICFPLRHSQMVTHSATAVAISVMWMLSSICPVIDIFYGIIMDPMFFSGQIFCFREMLVRTTWQIKMFQTVNGMSFVSVTLIIIFTYIGVIIAARGVSTDKSTAQKAKRTILLHFIQLIFCLTSLLYGSIEGLLTNLSNVELFRSLRFVNFLLMLILPRCLSPLIYGLRDDAVRPLFLYYVGCGSKKVKPSVNAH
ncbi:hypothetical protein ACEWY4_010068 [Coilia grayii]|uniref:G-protein coupled receptors family 1 profile domain-containing protein n=1 Tax=Coilia grayii TaxID=363190 RepID=A0ABD1K8C9_9TELE